MGKMVLPKRSLKAIETLLRSSAQTVDIIIGGFQEHQSIRSDGICPSLTSSMGRGGGYTPMIIEPKCKLLGTIEGGGYEKMFEEIRRVYSPDGISPTVTAKTGGNHEVKIAMEESNNNRVVAARNEEIEKAYVSEKGVRYILAPKRGACTDINSEVSSSLTRKGQSNWTGSFISPDIDHIKHNDNIGGKTPTDIYLKNGEKITSDDDVSHLRIRKLTPLECWRLMDFDDDDFYKAKEIESNTQLYAQAGNSIVVNCLVAIFGQMFDGKENVYEDRFREQSKGEPYERG